MSIQQIYDKYPLLTQKQRDIIDFMLDNPHDACYISLRKLSRLTRSSEVSVLRACTALGYEGFVQLKEAFRQHAMSAGRKLPSATLGQPPLSPAATAKQKALTEICGEEAARMDGFLQDLSLDDCFAEARALLKAGEVYVFGHDVSKVFADYIYHRLTFLRIKTTSVSLGDGSTVQSILARIKPGDHAIFLSFPPYHLPAVSIAKFVSDRGASVSVITDSADSPSVIQGCRPFVCSTDTRYFYNSHTIIMALVNLLASCVAIEMGGAYKDILVAEQAVKGYFRAESEDAPASAESHPTPHTERTEH